MATTLPYLLDTNIVLLWTRENSTVAEALDRQFGLRDSPFRPAICEVTVAELLAFAEKWGDKRRQLLKEIVDELLVLPISRPDIHQQWAKLYSHAKANGLAIQQDHNDVWIAATAKVAGLRLISSDGAAFLPLRGTGWVDVDVIDAKTGALAP
jgi:predicted nucleic acid-binding protein